MWEQPNECGFLLTKAPWKAFHLFYELSVAQMIVGKLGEGKKMHINTQMTTISINNSELATVNILAYFPQYLSLFEKSLLFPIKTKHSFYRDLNPVEKNKK